MTVELLYFDGCPGYEELLPRLRALIASEGIGAELELRRIETSAQAERERFLGSPTVRVDGVDVDPGAACRTDFGFECRLYTSEAGISRTPPEPWIRAALRRARAAAS
ncbi:MAG: hypothetical protein JST31_04805 [Actinobacteria bacterium]|nr:hypothetical protein [Actinomycetota bacterium]